jgi:hypothetical protein
MKLLDRDHPHAFPQSVIREKTDAGWKIVANAKPFALTRAEFKRLYSECGEVLHRGTIRTVQTSPALAESDYQRVLDWQRKIVDLMNEHMVGRANVAGFYIVSLRTESGFPECSVFTPSGSDSQDVQIFRMNVEA